MSSTASTLFGTGLHRAREVCDWLLEELEAEPEWIFGSEDARLWVAGPVGTYFRAEAAADATPGLGVVQVHTRLAYVDDLEAARAATQDLNRYTTTSRWAVIGDEGPPGWASPNAEWIQSLNLPYDAPPDAETFYRRAIAPPAARDTPPSLDVGVSFVVGDPDVELPLPALVLIVKEQIAKAVALVTNGFADPWGTPAVLVDENDEMRRPWSDVVHHYDRLVSPSGARQEPRLLAALTDAFDLQRQRQFETAPAAWYGSGDGESFICEVPYGPGPFPMGVIGMRSMKPHLSSAENETALMRGFPVPNPHVGEGLLLTLQLPVGSDREPAWWQADLLNAQTRLTAPGWSAAYAHGVGAWSVKDDAPVWSCFVPTYWADHLDADDLIDLFRRLLDNAPRLSWGARRVLERDVDLQHASMSGQLPPPCGATAGTYARGPEFGELPYGVDPGARIQGVIWDTLVGGDHAWASGIPGGFAFWTSRFAVNVTRSGCGCAEPGSLVQLSTVLATEPTPAQAETILHAHEAMSGGAVCLDEDGRLLLRMSLHAHDDLLSWMLDWAPVLAVAQVRAAETLGGLAAGSPHPERGWRRDRDQFLELLDAGQPWLVPLGQPVSTAALGLAPMLCYDLPLGGAWDGGDVVLSWLASAGELVGVLRTRCGKQQSALGVLVLRAATDVELADGTDASAWCLEANAALTDGCHGDTTAIGGWQPAARGSVRYRSEVPIALDPATGLSEHASWVATCLSHHTLAVWRTLQAISGSDLRDATAEVVAAEVHSLGPFYGRFIEFPDGMALVTEVSGGAIVVDLRRPLLAGAAGTARLGTTCRTDKGAEAVTRIVLSPEDMQPALRVLHAALLGSARPDSAFGPALRPLWDVSSVPSPGAIAYALTPLIDDGHVMPSEDLPEGEYQLPDGGLLQIRVQEHVGWGEVLQVDVHSFPPNSPTHEPGLGDWSDGLLRTTVPGVAFLPAHRRPHDVISLIVTAALRQAGTSA